MTKKLSLLFFICILSTLNINAEVYSGSCGTNVRYSLDTETGVLSITGIGAMRNYNNSTSLVPWYSQSSFIKTANIADGVTLIGSYAFLGCSGLTSVTIPNSVTSIGEYAFYGCSKLTSVTIPNSVTSIGEYAFYGCSKLTSVTIPNSVTSIGSSAFYNCSSLTSIEIPNSVTSIGGSAFSGCYNLTRVSLNSNVIVSKSYPYGSSIGNIFGSQVKEYILGDDVTSIGSYAFYNCSNVTSVTIADNVTSVGDKAFDGTAWYNNLPDGLFYAGKVAYKYNGIMPENTSMIIKEGTVKLNDNLFDGCTGLTSVYIPSSVKSIGNKAFANCTELLDVYCYARKSPTMGTDVFANSGIQFATLYVPEISVDGYKATEQWNIFGKIQALSGEYPEIPEITKCATPTIIFENGKLSFSCETEGVKYVYNFSTPSESDEDGKGINMPNKLQVSVYAKKDGFENSDVTTKEIDLGTSGIRGDVNNDGVVSMPDAMFIVNKILNGKYPDEEYDKTGVRFGFYETIPGYSVRIDKVNIEGANSLTIGSDVLGTTLKTSLANLTYDKADGGFSDVFLVKPNEKSIALKLDYTLTADDGSGEKIVVKDAVVTIPTQYIQWETIYKYTYIIKIYDNSNTLNWGETPVFNIFPATFDAIIIEDDNGQSTITNITTR